MVHLQNFNEKFADKGLQVFVISMHPDPKKARELTVDLQAKYPICNGHDSDLGKRYAYG